MKTRSAFTLIELLVVIAIIIILAGLIFTIWGSVRQKSYQTETKAVLIKIEQGLHLFSAQFESYPVPVTNVLDVESGGNRLAEQLMTKMTSRSSNWEDHKDDFLKDEIGKAWISEDGKAFVDKNAGDENGARLTYIYVPAGRTTTTDSDSDITTTAFEGFEREYELWSCGPDGKINAVRNHEENTDNIAAGKFRND